MPIVLPVVPLGGSSLASLVMLGVGSEINRRLLEHYRSRRRASRIADRRARRLHAMLRGLKL